MSRNVDKFSFPFWVAHRGGGNLAPENTMQAFEMGYKRGFRAFECDARITKDGAAVVAHDDDLARTGGIDAQIADLTLKQLQSYDLNCSSSEFRGCFAPTVEQVCAFCLERGCALNLEIKPALGLEEKTAKAAADAALPFAQKGLPILFSSFSEESLHWLERNRPQTQRALLKAFCVDEEALLQSLAGVGAFAANLYCEDLTESLVQQLHGDGYEVYVWTPETLDEAVKMASMGVDGVITDAVSEVGEKFLSDERAAASPFNPIASPAQA